MLGCDIVATVTLISNKASLHFFQSPSRMALAAATTCSRIVSGGPTHTSTHRQSHNFISKGLWLRDRYKMKLRWGLYQPISEASEQGRVCHEYHREEQNQTKRSSGGGLGILNRSTRSIVILVQVILVAGEVYNNSRIIINIMHTMHDLVHVEWCQVQVFAQSPAKSHVT